MKRSLTALLVLVTTVPQAALAGTRVNPVLLQEVKAMRASIDSGDKPGAAAVNQFVDSMLVKGVSAEDILTYAKTTMTASEYRDFQGELDVALRGVDLKTLSPDEFSEVLGRALNGSRSTGLSWSGCSQTYTGIAVLAAATVAAVIAILKSKIKTEIVHHHEQIDHVDRELSEEKLAYYEKRRQDTRKFWEDWRSSSRTSADRSVERARNWQTAYPARIQADQTEIADYTSRVTYKRDELDRLTRLAFLSEGDARQAYLDQMKTLSDDITSLQGWIQSDQSDIAWHQARMDLFARDPGAIETTIAEHYANRDSNIAYANETEIDRLAGIDEDQEWWRVNFGTEVNHPEIIDFDETVVRDERALARNLGIGAGVAGAIGGFLLVRGLGECR